MHSVTRIIFPSVCVQSYAQSDTVNSVLQCTLLTRVAILSGGDVPQVPQWHDASWTYFRMTEYIG